MWLMSADLLDRLIYSQLHWRLAAKRNREDQMILIKFLPITCQCNK